MTTDLQPDSTGWALATWVGILAGVASSLVFLTIEFPPWLGVTASDRLWTGLAGLSMMACSYLVTRSRRERTRRCGISACVFIGVATALFVVAPR
ncbi:hypothetical protein [Williamsia sp. CHRR-6]|uniref:hypothetical protein n=1 Tax=Williamsia sp. CHRR-6 TaxID=2835871 RepID=UPI001BDB3686|nr:hypothetical protein [Williamsia sp. CHRR-6]MBT0566052.1 hypothetical protein [Williamsia sp. CHRR-6]